MTKSDLIEILVECCGEKRGEMKKLTIEDLLQLLKEYSSDRLTTDEQLKINVRRTVKWIRKGKKEIKR